MVGPRRRQKRGRDEPAPNVANIAVPNVGDENDEIEDVRTFMDAFGNDTGDGMLSETEPDYGNDNESGSDGDDGMDDDVESDEDSEIRVAVPRKQKFKNLDAVMDEINYDSLPEQQKETYVWKSKDKNNPVSYEWTTDFSTQGRAPHRNIYRNRPGPSVAACRCTTLKELFDAYIDDYMIADVVTSTNAKIAKIRQEHPSAGTSNKYPYLKDVIPEEIHALFGMMYTRAVLKQNLLSVTRLYQHQHSNPIYKAVVSQNRFEFLLRIVQFDNVEDRAGMKIDSQHSETSSIRSTSTVRNCKSPPSCYRWTKHYPYRGRVTMKQYNPNKPAKNGVLYRSISDATLPYTYNTMPENRTQSHLNT